MEIPKAIRNSSVVIVCLSKNSITKEGYIQKEIKIALDAADEKPEGTIYIIPVRLEECEVPQRLKGMQWVDLFEENGYDKLITSFRRRAEDLGLDGNFFEPLNKDVQFLTTHINKIRSEIIDDSSTWTNSPFQWVVSLPPVKKGRFAKRLITEWCRSKGFTVEPVSNEDLLINGYKVSPKFSTLWSSGFYKFQQIRNAGYDFIICFGISPREAHCWLFERKIVIEKLQIQNISSPNVSFWFSINPNEENNWASDFGGSLEKASRVLKQFLG